MRRSILILTGDSIRAEECSSLSAGETFFFKTIFCCWRVRLRWLLRWWFLLRSIFVVREVFMSWIFEVFCTSQAINGTISNAFWHANNSSILDDRNRITLNTVIPCRRHLNDTGQTLETYVCWMYSNVTIENCKNNLTYSASTIFPYAGRILC